MNKPRHFIRLVFFVLIAVITAFVPSAQALTKEQITAFNEGIVYFDTTDNGSSTCNVITSRSSTTQTQSPSQQQIDNAKIIIGIAKTDGVGKAGALIGLMVGLDESHLLVLANINVPLSENNPNKQGDGSDHDSLGVFQQRISTNWSTLSTDPNNQAAVDQLMDATYDAEAFFGSPPGSNAPSALSKGLQNLNGWQSMQPWDAAQMVQGSGTASGLNYAAFQAQAQDLINQYYDSSPAIPLPLPVSGGSTAGAAVSSASGCVTSFTGDEHQLAQQILANPKITFDFGPNGIVANTFRDLAAGNEANLAPNSGTTSVSTAILRLILTIAQTHAINVSSLTDQHHVGDIHTSGDAVDLNILDGAHITGRDPGSITVINIATGMLPQGSGFGQQTCPGGPITLPAGFIEFPDSCDHLHVQVPRGTP